MTSAERSPVGKRRSQADPRAATCTGHSKIINNKIGVKTDGQSCEAIRETATTDTHTNMSHDRQAAAHRSRRSCPRSQSSWIAIHTKISRKNPE